MNRYIQIGMLITCFVLFGCNKIKVEPIDGKVNCRFEDKYWESTKTYAEVKNNKISIVSTNSEGKDELHFYISAHKVGKYNVGEGGLSKVIYVPPSGFHFSSNNENGTGVVEITSINEEKKEISGKFDFEAIQTGTAQRLQIEKGHFRRIPYVQLESSIPVDTFEAVVNGNLFTPKIIHCNHSNGKISISSTSQSTFPSMAISLPETAEVGDYTPSLLGNIRCQYNESGVDLSSANEGLITILSHDEEAKRIRGNFAFKDGEFQITEGYFSVVY